MSIGPWTAEKTRRRRLKTFVWKWRPIRFRPGQPLHFYISSRPRSVFSVSCCACALEVIISLRAFPVKGKVFVFCLCELKWGSRGGSSGGDIGLSGPAQESAGPRPNHEQGGVLGRGERSRPLDPAETGKRCFRGFSVVRLLFRLVLSSF